MSTDIQVITSKLWSAADVFRANSKLKASEYSVPVLGLIFLAYAENRFNKVDETLRAKGSRRRTIGPDDYIAQGVLYVPPEAKFKKLLHLPEGANIGQSINDAMRAVEVYNTDLKDILPKTYNKIDNETLIELLKLMDSIPKKIEGDVFGIIYEYFLGKFALKEGQKGGEFFTPTSLVRLIVEIIEPYKGRILDPACGSGGMFVQSARFVDEHKQNNEDVLSIHGEEILEGNVKLCKMNLAIHGLSGDIREGNTYYDDLHRSAKDGGRFDFVMANPPFNVDSVRYERLVDDPRFPFGLPSVDNGNYLWIQIFYSALNESGRAGFVMANSASDARSSELDIRKQLINDKAVDVMISIGPNFFYTVTLPCTLWFLDKGKQGTDREDKVLFIDARNIYNQIDRTHREFTEEQLEFLANIARLYRGEKPENRHNSQEILQENFPKDKYTDVPGLCKVATIAEIEAQGFSLNPGRYVGIAELEDEDIDFVVKLEELQKELTMMNSDANELEKIISAHMDLILDRTKHG